MCGTWVNPRHMQPGHVERRHLSFGLLYAITQPTHVSYYIVLGGSRRLEKINVDLWPVVRVKKKPSYVKIYPRLTLGPSKTKRLYGRSRLYCSTIVNTSCSIKRSCQQPVNVSSRSRYTKISVFGRHSSEIHNLSQSSGQKGSAELNAVRHDGCALHKYWSLIGVWKGTFIAFAAKPGMDIQIWWQTFYYCWRQPSYGSEEITEMDAAKEQMEKGCMRSFRGWKTSDNISPHVVAEASLFLKYDLSTTMRESHTSR
jgi:hypothetical protein